MKIKVKQNVSDVSTSDLGDHTRWRDFSRGNKPPWVMGATGSMCTKWSTRSFVGCLQLVQTSLVPSISDNDVAHFSDYWFGIKLGPRRKEIVINVDNLFWNLLMPSGTNIIVITPQKSRSANISKDFRSTQFRIWPRLQYKRINSNKIYVMRSLDLLQLVVINYLYILLI